MIDRVQLDTIGEAEQRLTLRDGEPLPEFTPVVFDELVAHGVEYVHIERMSESGIWMAVDNYRLNLFAERGVLSVNITLEDIMARKSSSQRKVKAAFREVKQNPPKQLAKTRRKKGAGAANKQRVAIALNKARAAGARIPKKK